MSESLLVGSRVEDEVRRDRERHRFPLELETTSVEEIELKNTLEWQIRLVEEEEDKKRRLVLMMWRVVNGW